MSGHATPGQTRDISLREREVTSAASTATEVIELALLHLEPGHNETRAIQLLEAIVEREPRHGVSRVWLTYALLHSAPDPAALTRAAEVLRPLVDTGQHGAAAAMLLAEILHARGAGPGPRVKLLKTSVTQEPDWANNRHDLAWAYAEAGRRREAAEHLEHALTTLRPPDPDWSPAQRAFEESITGRSAFGAEERLRADLLELRTSGRRRPLAVRS